MTDKEFEILSFLVGKQSVPWIDVLNAFLPSENLRENESILRTALDQGFIEKTWKADRPPSCSIRLTAKGHVAIAEENRRRLSQQQNIDKQQRQTNKPKHRKDRTKQIISVLSAIIGIAASVVAVLEFLFGFLG